jgi:hypothetical protein
MHSRVKKSTSFAIAKDVLSGNVFQRCRNDFAEQTITGHPDLALWSLGD